MNPTPLTDDQRSWLAAFYPDVERVAAYLADRYRRDRDDVLDVCTEAAAELAAALAALPPRSPGDVLRRFREACRCEVRKLPRYERLRPDVAAASGDPAGEASVAELLNLLDEKTREIVARHVLHGESFEVIARSMGISRQTAWRRHKDAMQALRSKLRADNKEF